MDVGTCEHCGRICWLFDGRWVHPCCVVEIERWGRKRCEACEIAESAQRRWERRIAERASA